MHIFADIEASLAEQGIFFKGTDQKHPVSVLFPEERSLISSCIERRKDEFSSSRWCAREVLSEMGRNPVALMNGPDGEPVWPEGICGSISHTEGAYCAAAAFSGRKFISLGIDVERLDRPVSRPALEYIGNDDELEWLRTSETKNTSGLLEKLVFSAKESIFKALFLIVKQRFSFDAVSLLKPAVPGIFNVVMNKQLGNVFTPGDILTGRYWSDTRFVLTMMSVLK
jgi:4'-phosphopantetheinyl transferase EntD